MKPLNLTLYLGGTRSGKSLCAETRARQTKGPVLYVATATCSPDDPSMQERIRRHRARRPASWQTLECPLHLAGNLAPAVEALSRVQPVQKTVLPGETALLGAASASGAQSAESPAGDRVQLPASASGTQAATPQPDSSSVPSDGQPTILLDCVTLWLSNLLFSLPDPEDTAAFEAAVSTEVEDLLALMARSQCRWIVVSGETGLGGIAPDRLTRTFADGLGLANQLLAQRAREAFLVVAGRTLSLSAPS